jgi:hypothetical protein
MAETSKLETIAKKYRKDNLYSKNIYSKDNTYSEVHPNATQEVSADDINNEKGKGTGVIFDTENGGSSVDINGDPNLISKTGRAATVTNKYNKNNQYNIVVSEDF